MDADRRPTFRTIVGVTGAIAAGLGIAGALVTYFPGDGRVPFGTDAIVAGAFALVALVGALVAYRSLYAAAILMAVPVFGYAVALQTEFQGWIEAYNRVAGTVAESDAILSSATILLFGISSVVLVIGVAVAIAGEFWGQRTAELATGERRQSIGPRVGQPT